jgi:hypothetical protein
MAWHALEEHSYSIAANLMLQEKKDVCGFAGSLDPLPQFVQEPVNHGLGVCGEHRDPKAAGLG